MQLSGPKCIRYLTEIHESPPINIKMLYCSLYVASSKMTYLSSFFHKKWAKINQYPKRITTQSNKRVLIMESVFIHRPPLGSRFYGHFCSKTYTVSEISVSKRDRQKLKNIGVYARAKWRPYIARKSLRKLWPPRRETRRRTFEMPIQCKKTCAVLDVKASGMETPSAISHSAPEGARGGNA